MQRNAICILASAMLATALTGPSWAADLQVPSQYGSIAAALAATEAGDRVILAPGVYQEYDLDLPAGITLLGNSASPSSVVINAGGRGRVLRAESLDQETSITGLTLIGGSADGDNPYDSSGGGLLVSQAQVRLTDTNLVGNTASASGGGLRVSHGSVTMLRCEVRDNRAGRGGGGIELSYDAEFDALDLTVHGNTAAWGGGMAIRAGSLTSIFEADFRYNHAEGSPGLGGAVACDQGCEPSFKLVVMADNTSSCGGAVYAATEARPVFRNTTLDGNEAAEAGAALYLKGAVTELDRSIVSFHPQSAVVCVDDGLPMLSACDVYGNAGGDWVGALASQGGVDRNFSADPLYCSPVDRHLRDDSPCAPAQSGMGQIGACGVDCGTITDVPEIVAAATLGAHPNPFNPRTEVTYSLPVAGWARVSVYDIRGRRLDVLADGEHAVGEHRVTWDARDQSGRSLASGTYLLVMETGGQRLMSKLALLR